MRFSAWLRDERVVCTIVLVALAVGNVVPFWIVTWPPLGDFGGHVELMDVVGRYGAPDTAYAEVYRVVGGVQANTFHLCVARLAGGAVSSLTLAKLLLSAYVLALPLAAMLVCVAFGRSPWLAISTVPWSFNAMLSLASVGFVTGLPLLFATIASARLWLSKGARLDALCAVTSLTCTALFFFHVLHFLLGTAVVAALVLAAARSLRDVRRLLVLVPALVPFGAWFHRKFVALEATETGLTLGTGSLVHYGAVHLPLRKLVSQIYFWGPEFFRDRSDEVTAFLVVTACVFAHVCGFSARPRWPSTNRLRWLLDSYALEGLVLALAVAYFFVPSHAVGVALVTERLVVVVMLLAVLTPRARLRGRALRAFLLFGALTSVVYSVRIAQRFCAFERDVLGGMPAAIAALPAKSRLGYVMWDATNPITPMGATWHVPKAVHAVTNGGVTDDSFAATPQAAVQYLPGKTPRRLPRRFWNDPSLHAWDAVLLASTDEQSPELREALATKSLRLRFHEGRWWLFEVATSTTLGRGGLSP